MTALKEYQRLEATGLWRATPDDQRREVIVSLGDATLVISDLKDQALTHWSLAAVARANPDETPAIYHPDGDPGETLELGAESDEMIAAIEKVRAAVNRRRPRPGRLRLVSVLATLTALTTLFTLYAPNILISHTVSVVPMANREAIGRSILGHMQRVTGTPCAEPTSMAALARLGQRLPGNDGAPAKLVVVRSGLRQALQLPGGYLMLSHELLEDYEEPDVAAGFIVTEQQRARLQDPLDRLLRSTGMISAFRLLTTGTVSDDHLKAYAEEVLSDPPIDVPTDPLVAAFKAKDLRTTPYAYALDISGETSISLIEADPFPNTAPRPVLTDSDWVRLQNICGG